MATAKGREHEEIKAGHDVIEVNEEIKIETRPAPPKVDYPGRSMISEEMSIFIDKCSEKFNDKGNTVFSSGNVIIYRSQIDELITDQYLDNNHVDAFARTLAEKNKISPGLYKPFIFVSSFQWFVNHINKDSIRTVDLLLIPVIHNDHWTLLVGNLIKKCWAFYDSLHKATHVAILPEVIKHFYEETQRVFVDNDIRQWPISLVVDALTQKNSFDCGMFV
ncbi:hypothetical protein IEQ34_002244 [Dendrobium chrysotoxum]|uniref:Ubiquitin-like protease family profile domain-containing protein n=1 Tax=Dendrobium chrysotoxum TaxID=161865 RepID=A0AAV7HKR9_DENCH|nr:hypothetical protein IEQ34_002244 [Dendrobium chrysotoxum]